MEARNNSIMNEPNPEQQKMYWQQELGSALPVPEFSLDYPQNITFIDLFEEQVLTTPDSTAVVFEDEKLRFHELNEKANQVAHALIALGVQAETLVGICVERSLDMIIALMGVLKAGGAYVPLDPDYPQERLRFMLEDCDADILLTQGHLHDRLPDFQGRLLDLDDTALFEQYSVENPGPRSAPEDLVYVIYTSGSTGKPKGVMIEHRSLLNAAQARRDYYQGGAETRLLLLPSFAFDAFGAGVFHTLSIGGCLYLPKYSGDTISLANLIKEQGISHFVGTPSVYQELLRQPTDSFATLRSVVLGGETASPALLQHHFAAVAQADLFNEYGPTECTIWSTVFQYQPDSETIGNIGCPIADIRVYILGADNQIQPVGVSGELCIAGAGLARGYLNRPDLTAEKFVEVELAGKQERIYRTGDLARQRPDGNLEYLGRMDHQVKLRGFRIELGGIEAALTRHEAVGEAAVTVQERAGNKFLAAYLTKVTENSISHSDLLDSLKDFLKKHLPDYMIPSSFTMLEKMPLTPNGKIDRKALPEPALSVSRETYEAPRTREEKELARIWEEILGLEQVGIHDSFFELGGHSLLATQLVARIRESLNVVLQLSDLFSSPTVRGLVNKIQEVHQAGEQKAPLVLPVITPDPEARHDPFPLNEIQQAYWLGRDSTFAMGNVAPHSYSELDCPNFDVARLEQAWQQVVERHEMLRAVVLPDGRQQILPQVPAYRIELVDLSDKDPETRRIQLEETRQTMSEHVFEVSQWPLFDIRVTRIDKETMRLHFSLDFIVSDGWSIFVIYREWWRFYQNPFLHLKPLALSFRDYILAEQAWHEEAAYQNAMSYWRKRLESLPAAPQLPLARQPESLEQPHFTARSFKLNIEEWEELQRKTAKAGITPSAFLMAVFGDILALWSRSAHFTLNLTLFNRLPVHREINELVGDFTSLVLLEVDNQGFIAFRERARQVQERLWEDLEHHYVSGVSVMREMASLNREGQHSMPVVFTSMLALDGDQSESVLGDLGKQVFTVGITPQVWIDFCVRESSEGLELFWYTVDELFPEGLLDDMFSACQQHIRLLLDNDTAWEDISTGHLLPESHTALQTEVNSVTVPQSEHFMDSLFREQAEKQPDHPAVISGDTQLSYGELQAAALQIGNWLRQQGAGRNKLVAVVMEKGWEQPVAVMAVLYANAAYVPIDPNLPEQRQQFLLQETGAEIVLTQSRLQDCLCFPETVQVLSVDRHELPPCDALPDLSDRNPGDLAYIIYTSGSTGMPKGVVIDHRGAVNTLLDINRRFQVTPQDRVLTLSALNFDLSVYDIFGVLGAGGTIVMPDPGRRRDPQHWAELMTRHGITLWNTVPALMQMLVDYQDGQPLDVPLRLVLMSGDWIPLDLPERIRKIRPDAAIISLGGATEVSIWSICYPVETVNPAQKSIPYGKPLTNQTFHVLNEQLEPCPIHVPGQLYIGGIGLALGYWHDQKKTDAAFFIHPRTGERLYRTGDLGCWLADGNIEFLGREDSQVKIRGHRIELGEVETHLQRHPKLKEAAVIAVPGKGSGKQLAAYIVPADSAELSGTADDQAAYGLQTMQGLLTDPTDRLAFKLKQPGLRNFKDNPQEVVLPAPETDVAAYTARQSYREFLPGPITAEQLGSLLAGLAPRMFPDAVLPKYRYGSAGSLYPVQTYLHVKKDQVNGLEGGFYYYRPDSHRLVLLSSEEDRLTRKHHGGSNQLIFVRSCFSIFLAAEYQAIEPMYGKAARDFCLLEAGSMGQLLMTEATEHGLGLCPIGGMDYAPVQTGLGLGDSQELMYSFLGGPVSPEQTQSLPGPVSVQTEHEENTQGTEESLEATLKADLKQILPAYMLPTVYVSMEKLPLTENGKIDRKSLPEPETCQHRTEIIVPTDDMERRLLELIQDHFKQESLSMIDDFFDLGANSLDLVRLYNTLAAEFQREIRVADMFRHPTAQGLAELLRQAPQVVSDNTEHNTETTIAELSPEQIELLSANVDNLSEAEVEQLLAQLEQE
jgi:amino acid adenylation domain-containing protein